MSHINHRGDTHIFSISSCPGMFLNAKWPREKASYLLFPCPGIEGRWIPQPVLSTARLVLESVSSVGRAEGACPLSSSFLTDWALALALQD